MSWGLGWKRSAETFRLILNYGAEDLGDDLQRSSTSSSASSSSSSSVPSSRSVGDSPRSHDQDNGLRVDLYWTAGEDEEQVTLRLQSQLMVALPSPQDSVIVDLRDDRSGGLEENVVTVEMRVVTKRDPLRGVILTKTGEGQRSDGTGVLTRLLRSDFSAGIAAAESKSEYVSLNGSCGEHWKTVTLLSVYGCGISVLPPELFKMPLLEKLYLDNNKIAVLPLEVGELRSLKILSVDNNFLVSVPELKHCAGLIELSLEHNKLVRPLLDFRALVELETLRLFGNPLEYLPDILPLQKLRHLSLANIRVVADENLKSVNVQIEAENASYFGASKHKLSAFFSLIFRFSSCHHPLLASALGKIMQDQANCVVVGKDENAVRQLISMISSDNSHVVERACSALSALAEDVTVAMQLMKCDIMQSIESVMRSLDPEGLISVLQVLSTMAFTSDSVSQKMLTKDVLKSLKHLCSHKETEVQRLALLSVGNMAFCLDNRSILATSESLRDLLLRLTLSSETRVSKAAARALAVLGENETLRRAIKGRPVGKQGLRILSMDGGGMKGLATVQILKAIEKGTGKRIHELFDLICGTSTGGMLAVALGIKLMTLSQCEEIYKNLGKLVFAEPGPKDNEAASWREKLDQIYKSSSQNFRVVVHGSKHSADHFEKLLKEMCADEDGDLLIESAVKPIPKVFVVSTLVSVNPAQPFIFRNYQYPAGTAENPSPVPEATSVGSPSFTSQVAYKRSASIGSCKHKIWQAIRASSAAPYYLDDFSLGGSRWQDGAIVANNPTIFALREAQLLWPDTKIDCLVSVGCGSVPTKVRKGGWRYFDTGQVLIESACSVDRVEEALSTLLPMLPDIHYFRFNPVDERCDMELDETDPAVWLKLETAVEDYVQKNSDVVRNACERLFPMDDAFRIQLDESSASLGWRRSLLLVEALHSPDSGRGVHHARFVESFCARSGISFCDGLVSSRSKKGAFPSPLVTGSFPSSPLLHSPEFGARAGRIDLVPPLSLDGAPSRFGSLSPPKRQLSSPAKSLYDKLQNFPQVGVVHLALQNDSYGSILSWQNDVFVVAEPGDLAEKFLQNVKFSLLSSIKKRRKKMAELVSNISNVADLVRFTPYFQVGNVNHRYIGRQTQVMEDGQEIGAYMFRRTVPSLHLSPGDVRNMVGAWRERIVVCSGTYGPTGALINSLLDSGAKAVVCSSLDPSDVPLISHDMEDFSIIDKVRFEIGEDEEEEDPPRSPDSDWEDSDGDLNGSLSPSFCLEDDENELSLFLCEFYDSLFRAGEAADHALRTALSAHKSLRFTCHLPTV